MSQENVDAVRGSLDGWNRGDVDALLVVALARIRARGEASGVDLESPIAYVYEFAEGLARKVRSYFDPREAFKAAGLRE